MNNRRISLASIVLVLAAVAPQARANVALEYYEVGRPAGADASVGAFLAELSGLGYVAAPDDVRPQLGNQLALPALTASAPKSTAKKPAKKLTPRSLLTDLANAHTQVTQAPKLETLLPTLTNVVNEAFDNPAFVVTDPAIRDNLKIALLDLVLVNSNRALELRNHSDIARSQRDIAQSQQDLAMAKQLQKASEDWMAEWILTFTGEVITQKRNGPDAEMLYTHVRNEREKLGRGTLVVNIDDPNVLFYVDEVIRSSLQPVSLLPGCYRVLLMAPNDDARVFKLDVRPNQMTRLDVHWDITSSLIVTSSSVALGFSSTVHPDTSQIACRLARTSGHGNGGVALVGLESEGKKWTLVASLYNARSCQLLRRGHVMLGMSVTSKGASALARFIARGAQDPDVIVTADIDPFETSNGDPFRGSSNLAAAPPPANLPAPEVAPPTASWPRWTVTGVAASSLALGSYSLYLYYSSCNPQDPSCKYSYTRAGLIGYGGIGVGVALGGLATYLFFRDAPSSSASRLTLTPLRAGVLLGWTAGF